MVKSIEWSHFSKYIKLFSNLEWNTVADWISLIYFVNDAGLRHVKALIVIGRPTAIPNGGLTETWHELAAAACERPAPAPRRSGERRTVPASGPVIEWLVK